MTKPKKRHNRWPLFAIGASAGAAVWSGWVGLGELVGFGVVHPLPGIADSVAINTAITLPIGVEAYAMYALSVATSSRTMPGRTRRFAWTSAIVSLVLGMGGQVAYHLMEASGMTSAPWQLVAGVSCLPVAVLGAASVLWHLASDTDEPPSEKADDQSPVHVTAEEKPATALPAFDQATVLPKSEVGTTVQTSTPDAPTVKADEPEPARDVIEPDPREKISAVTAPGTDDGYIDAAHKAAQRIIDRGDKVTRDGLRDAMRQDGVAVGAARAGRLLTIVRAA